MRIFSFLICIATITATKTVVGADFNIEEWNLGVIVQGNGNNFAGSVFLDVVDPFVDDHSVSVLNSTSSASYSFWNEQGRFLIEADIAADAAGNSSLISAADGRIHITPTEDLVIQYSSVYDVTLPAHSMTSQLNLDVIDLATNEEILDETRVADTVFGLGPRHYELSGEFVMPAGRTWTISYSFRIIASASSSGNLGIGSGFVEFVIVPEPTTILLAVPPALLLARRRNRCAT